MPHVHHAHALKPMPYAHMRILCLGCHAPAAGQQKTAARGDRANKRPPQPQETRLTQMKRASSCEHSAQQQMQTLRGPPKRLPGRAVIRRSRVTSAGSLHVPVLTTGVGAGGVAHIQFFAPMDAVLICITYYIVITNNKN
jgi:hypothetical protein